MIATITVSRRDNRSEDRDFLVDVTRDRDGDIYATCGEDLDELRTTNRHGSIETHPTGRLFQRRGDPIELTDGELEEAEAALTQLEALWQSERARLKQIFAPISNVASPGLTIGNCDLESDCSGDTEATEQSEIACRRPPEGRDEAEANAEIGCGKRGTKSGLSRPPNASPKGPLNFLTLTRPGSDFAPPPENESGSGTLKNAQARSNTSSSEAVENIKSPAASVNSPHLLLRHDLLNSQGRNITLPPGAPTGSLAHSAVRLPSSALADPAAHE